MRYCLVRYFYLLMLFILFGGHLLVLCNPRWSKIRVSRQLQEDQQQCPSDSNCVNYRSCVQGIVSTKPSEEMDFKKLSLEELKKIGIPCGNLEARREVCCRQVTGNDDSVAATKVETGFHSLTVNETCPVGLNCISYRWCANGIVTNVKSGFEIIGPSFKELEEYGRPCGNTTVCCRGTPPILNKSADS